MIRQSGEAPEVIEYLKNPPSRARLIELIKAMAIPVRALLREKGTPCAELGLADPKWSDDQLIDFMLAHPILINRPIVVTPKGVRLCRPSEAVLDILPKSAYAVADYWQQLGVGVETDIRSVQAARDPEYTATFPAFALQRQTPPPPVARVRVTD